MTEAMWQIEFAEKLKSAAPSARKLVLKEYSEKTGYSTQSLYRIAKEHGFSTGRVRKDKGAVKCGLTDGQVEFIAALLYVTGRENKGPIMPVERALQIAVDNGIIAKGQTSVQTLTRILRERQLSKKHQTLPSPHVDMRSLHPNHTHAVDVSVCIQYYLKNGRLGIMDERDFYKNKPDNYAKVKTRLLRYVLVDHFSGAFFWLYFNTTGETKDNLYEFLKNAWAKKQDDRLPFRGVPFHLLMDTGAANKSKAIVAMLERLGVNIPKGRPYNPRRQGAVETAHNIIEEWFESGLRIQPATGDVVQINEWAFDFNIWFQSSKPHSRHGMPRSSSWMSIKKEELRELPPADMLEDLFANPEETRGVDGTLCISYRGNTYSLKHVDGNFKTAKEEAILKPFMWPEIDIRFRGRLYEANVVETLPAHLGGFRSTAVVIGSGYKSQPETLTQEAKKRFDNMVYGEEKKKDAVPFEGITVFGIHGDKVENVAFMEKQGTPIEVERSVTEKNISMTEFLKRLKLAIGVVSPELNQSLRARYGGSIDVKEAEEEIRRLEQGQGNKEEIAAG